MAAKQLHCSHCELFLKCHLRLRAQLLLLRLLHAGLLRARRLHARLLRASLGGSTQLAEIFELLHHRQAVGKGSTDLTQLFLGHLTHLAVF